MHPERKFTHTYICFSSHSSDITFYTVDDGDDDDDNDDDDDIPFVLKIKV